MNSSAQSTYISVQDTRNTNEVPAFYKTKLSVDFKQSSVIGLPGASDFSGLLTFAPWIDNTGGKNHQLAFSEGGLSYRIGSHLAAGWEPWRKIIIENSDGRLGLGTNSPAGKLHIIGTPESSTGSSLILGDTNLSNLRLGYNTSYTWIQSHGRVPLFINEVGNDVFITPDAGNVGIGTTDTKGYKLAVGGNMIAESVKVKLKGTWPDFVFDKSYQLPTLKETEVHIKEKGHLQGIPSASDVKVNGIDLGEMNAKLLQKIEELTLHLIEQSKRMKAQDERLLKQEEDISILKGILKSMNK